MIDVDKDLSSTGGIYRYFMSIIWYIRIRYTVVHILVSFFEISHSHLTFQPLGLTRMSTIFCDFLSSLKLSVKFGNNVLRFSYPREKKSVL